MTRRERLERKAELRSEWAIKASARASQRFDTARAATEGIPFGQPILVGHHSEGRHRAALARQDNNMRKACEETKLAEHHEQCAAGLERQLDRSIYSDDADAIAQLEARIAEHEQERETNNAINTIVRRKPKNECTAEKLAALVALGVSEGTAGKLFSPDFCGRFGIPAYVNQNLGGRIQNDKQRLENIKRRQIRTKYAEAAPNGILIELDGEWMRVTFAEKPERSILNDLKDAGFTWGGGYWHGQAVKLPDSVQKAQVPA